MPNMLFNYNNNVILSIIYVISINLCLTNANVILNDNRGPIERPVFGNNKVFSGKTDTFEANSDNSNVNKRYDNKDIDYKKIAQQLKKQGLEPVDLKLYGYATAIDPRAQNHHNQHQQQHRPNIINPELQFNQYQQLLNSMKINDASVPSIHNPYQIPQMGYQPNSEEEAINVMKNYLKKYDMKKYFLKKILGEAYDREEGHEDGFFANTHLRRHGTAGMAAKVFGELIGIKIRKMIEGFGETASDYAKDLTTNGVVTIGNSFSKLFRFS